LGDKEKAAEDLGDSGCETEQKGNGKRVHH
jgi:hypothetical protein